MNRCRKFLTGLLVSAMFFSAGTVSSRAAETEGPYQYQVTFYAGNQGVFADTGGIQVTDAAGGLVHAEVHKSADGSSVRVDGLEAGYFVSFTNLQGGAVDTGDESAYYVRGIRESGYDNSLSRSSFEISRDQDYVVAYGISGEMVAYEVRFEDASGRTLADSRFFRGNVGDRPVVAFLYIEGYQPQAYNLTKTLSVNEAENVFTFVYSRASTGGGGGGGGTAAEGGGTAAPAETPAAGDAGAAGAGGAVAGGAGAGAGGGAGDAAADAPDAGGVTIPDEEVPQDAGPEDLIDLDDEEVPLAEGIGGIEEGTANMLGATAVGVTAAAAFLALLIIVIKRRKKAVTEGGDEE